METPAKNKITIQSFLIALTVVLAFGFSAFTNAHSNKTFYKAKKSGMTIDAFVVQDGGAGSFSQSTSYTSSKCSGSATLDCGYSVTTSGQSNIPNQASYTSSEISSYVTHGWLTPAPGASAALYND